MVFELGGSVRKVLVGVWACAACAAAGQTQTNLVPNPSFEERAWCPTDINTSTLRTLAAWTSPNAATPDHFDACGSANVAVPANSFGSQDPVSGSGYAGIVVHSQDRLQYREFLQAKLTRPLVADEWVCVSFWVCPADVSRYVADGVGAALTPEALTVRGEGPLPVVPQVDNPRLHVLSDRHSWLQLSEAVQASGGEAYVTVGNFREVGATRVLERKDWGPLSNDWAYLYVDDIRVEPITGPEACSRLVQRYAAEVTDPPWQTYLTEEVDWRNVLFEFDRSDLTEEARAQLDTVADRLLRNRFLVIEVNGHTDIVGDDGYNLELSERRARSVMDYLIWKGIDPNRLRLAWHGFHTPTADNTTEDGRRQNRRVEFTVLEHAFLPAER